MGVNSQTKSIYWALCRSDIKILFDKSKRLLHSGQKAITYFDKNNFSVSLLARIMIRLLVWKNKKRGFSISQTMNVPVGKVLTKF